MNAADLDPLALPPHSIEAEQAALGSMLIDNRAAPRVLDVLGGSDFYDARHRPIFSAIARLIHEDEAADVLTVAECLRATGELEGAGGLVYLQGLANSTPSAANVVRYAEIVRDRARQRRLAGNFETLRCAALAPGADLGAILQDATARLLRAAESGAGAGVQIIRGDTITPESVRWLWPQYLALGKLHLIGGAPGTGKTTLALALGAALTCGGRWPDGTRAPIGDFAIWSGEDAIADTLAPRLIACGADMARVHFVGARRTGDVRRPFDPARDFPALAEALGRIPALRLLQVDPVVSAVSGDSHKNSEVRRGLQPVVDFAEATDCAVLGITHFSKGTAGKDPIERVTGSVAFGALPRVIFATVKQSEAEGGGRLLIRAKSNIGPDGGAFRYQLRQVDLEGEHAGIAAMRPEWCGTVEGEAREILDAAEALPDPAERGAKAEAEAFLREALAYGPVPQKQIQADAKGAGIAERTLYRAKADLKITATKAGMKSGWSWSLPAKTANEPYSQNVAAFGEIGSLQEGDANSANTLEGCQEYTKAAKKSGKGSWQSSQSAEDYKRAKDGE